MHFRTLKNVVLAVLSCLLMSSNSGSCQMSYSKPRYARMLLPPSSFTTLPPKQYGLFAYTDGFARYSISRIVNSLTLIIFFPGNVGSYKQIRSIASRIIRKIPEGVLTDAIEHYTFDFGEEFSALSAYSMQSQVEYASDAISSLVEMRMKSLDIHRSEISIILIGHSMGGTVATAMFTQPSFPSDLVSSMYILGSPIRTPVLTTEFALHDFYDNHRRFWILQKSGNLDSLFCVAVSGGMNDLLVESCLSDLTGIFNGPHSISVVASEIPTVDVSVEHQVLVWCSELVEVIASSVIALIDLEASSSIQRKERRNDISQREKSRFSYPWLEAVNMVLASQLSKTYDDSSPRVNFEILSEGSSCQVKIPLPSWPWAATTMIYSTLQAESISICSSTYCEDLLFSESFEFNSSIGEFRSITVFEDLQFSDGEFILLNLQSDNVTNSSCKAWGTFYQNFVAIPGHWGEYTFEETSGAMISLGAQLLSDLFFDVLIESLECSSQNEISAFGLLTSDNAEFRQGAMVFHRVSKVNSIVSHENSTTSTVSNRINMFFSLDPKCRYKIVLQPQWLSSVLSTLFHDFAIMPQIILAMVFFLICIQIKPVEPRKLKSLHSLILDNIQELVIICAAVAVLLPVALDYRIPNRGPGSSIPLPASHSLWTILATCIAVIFSLDLLLNLMLHPALSLTVLSHIPLDQFAKIRSLAIIFTITLPVYFLHSALLYSVIIVTAAFIQFLFNGIGKIESGYPIIPRVLRCSWLIVYIGLMPACIPHWSSHAHINIFGSLYHLVDYVLFILSNWTFLIGPIILAPQKFYSLTTVAMATFAIVLLIWAPRSIAIFPAITFFLWVVATIIYVMDSYKQEIDKQEVFLNRQDKVE